MTLIDVLGIGLALVFAATYLVRRLVRSLKTTKAGCSDGPGSTGCSGCPGCG